MLVLLTVIVLAGGGFPGSYRHHQHPKLVPDEHALVAVSRSGKTVASSHLGYLKVRLRPGKYQVSSSGGCTHRTIRVRANHPTHVKLECVGK
jgi:hypothetical protein